MIKHRILRSVLGFALAGAALCLAATTSRATAAAPALHVAALPMLADATPAVTAPAAAPFYSSSEFWGVVLAVVGGLFGIWRNNAASRAQKINESLVLGIEQATKIPEVAAFEQRIKGVIQDKATEYGVQPVLHRLVQDLTEPAATAQPTPPA